MNVLLQTHSIVVILHCSQSLERVLHRRRPQRVECSRSCSIGDVRACLSSFEAGSPDFLGNALSNTVIGIVFTVPTTPGVFVPSSLINALRSEQDFIPSGKNVIGVVDHRLHIRRLSRGARRIWFPWPQIACLRSSEDR
jgi:hypothetical protein